MSKEDRKIKWEDQFNNPNFMNYSPVVYEDAAKYFYKSLSNIQESMEATTEAIKNFSKVTSTYSIIVVMLGLLQIFIALYCR